MNNQKAAIISAIRVVFRSKEWLARYNIPYKLIPYLGYFCNKDTMKRNAELLNKYRDILYNIGYIKALGFFYTNC